LREVDRWNRAEQRSGQRLASEAAIIKIPDLLLDCRDELVEVDFPGLNRRT
jgi:hypothetical protein